MPLLIVLIFLAQTAGNDSVREYVWYFALEQLFSTFCNVLKGGIDHSLELVSRNNDNRSFPSSKQRQPWCKEALWRHHVWIQQAGNVLRASFVNNWYKIWWGTSYICICCSFPPHYWKGKPCSANEKLFSIENLLLQLIFLLDTENWGASLKTTQHMNGRPLYFSSEWLSLLFVL